MSKKHFEAAAAKINGMVSDAAHLRSEGNAQGADHLLTEARGAASVFSSVAREFNPRFDDSRFYAACGLN